MATPTSVDAYIDAAAPERQAGLRAMRAIITAAAPHADEVIAYQMPALRLRGRFLVSYAAYKRHYSLFPATEAVERELGDAVAPYLAGKGTIRFPADQDLPLGLIGRIVAVRVIEEEAAHPPKRTGTSS